MSTCIGYAPASGTPCTREAVDTVVAGCVHEHVAPRPLCQFHIADLAHEQMLCGDCQISTDPHRCVLVAAPIRSRA